MSLECEPEFVSVSRLYVVSTWKPYRYLLKLAGISGKKIVSDLKVIPSKWKEYFKVSSLPIGNYMLNISNMQ